MNLIQQPDALSLSMNLKKFIVGAQQPISFVLRKGNDTLLSQSYVPGTDGIIEVDVRDIVHSHLSHTLKDSGIVYKQTALADDFTAVIDGLYDITFRVIRSGVDRLADSASNFLTQNFLTWQPTVKPVTYYSPEFLTYYAVIGCTAKLKAYFTADGKVTTTDISLANMQPGIAYTLPLQYSVVAGLLGNRMPSYYDVWIENADGHRLTYIQRYCADAVKPIDEDWVLFENSLGGLDTFRAYGSSQLDAEHTHNIAEIDEESVEYRVDTARKYKKNTGYLNKEQSRWLLDFFPAQKKYIYTGNYLRQIVVVESDVTANLRTLPSSYTFTYKYADARPLLNLPRTEVPAEVLTITVPEVGSFMVPPRLAEFPRLPLSEGALIPIQSPYSEEWGTTTPGELAEFIGQAIKVGGDGGGNVDINRCLRKDQPDETNYLTGFNAGIALGTGKKKLIDIIRLDDDIEASDEKVFSSLSAEHTFLLKNREDKTLYPIDFMGGLSINSKRIGDIIRYYDEKKPVATDANIYSALMTDQRIDDAFGSIDDWYIRKNKVDFAHKHITFEEGITVYQLAETMNLDVKNLATIAQAVVSILRSSKFVDGFFGEGYRIWQDIATGDWSMTLDRLTVRKVMTIYELVLQKIRSVGGMVVISAANGKVKSVEHIGNSYVFEFEDTNTFVANDLMRCQVFSSAGLKYYWVKIASVNGEYVTVPVSEFNGIVPTAGDECVLMGNTTDKRRQNLIMISATEDGQPRFDCLDGVKSKSFEGCLKVRVGALDGISDSRFPADMQPSGYGLYGNNCFLTGIFVLANGKDVMTMFTIMEGMIKSEISSVRNEINAKDNYLNNAAFSDNLSYWTGTNDIRLFTVNGKFLYFNNNFYSNKVNYANIVTDGNKNVLQIKNSSIVQANSDLAQHPEFDLYDITETDTDGNEIVTGKQYRARMFYVSFKYKVTRQGVLRVYFKNESNNGFEEYACIDYTEHLNPSEEFKTMEIAGKWNGTGDFYLSFTGDIYIYSLALTDNRLADVEEKFTMRFEATDKKIQANLDEINKTGTKLEEYHSEFLLTARQMQIQFSEDLSDTESRVTASYKSYVNLTARDLTVQFTEDLTNKEKKITEAYTSAIDLSARGLRADFTADIKDMEAGITAAYKSYVNLTAQNLQVGFNEDLTDLRTGITADYQSAIDLSARGLRADFNSSISDVSGRLTTHTSSFHVTASQISAMVSATDSISNTIKTAGWITTADGNKLWATISTVDGINGRLTTHTASFHVTATKIEGIVEEITTQGSNYSKLLQTVDTISAEVSDVSGKYANLEITVNAIGALVGDGSTGSFSEFQQTVEKLTGQVAENKTAAAGALSAAKSASSAASNAQSAANAARDKADSNATAIVQTQSSISAIAGRFNADGSLKEGAGWVTTTEANTSWVKKNGIISAINQTSESVTIDAARINLNGVVTANKTFKINLDGSMEATGGKIGGFRIVDNGLTNSNENGSFTNDAYVIFRNDTHGCFAGIGGNILPSSTGLRAVGRFENHDKSDWFGMNETNYACIFSAKNAVNNYAIYMENGVIGGMAVKVRQINTTTTLNHSDCWVSCYNTSAINVYLPSNPQVGKLIYVMRVNNAKVTVQGNGKNIIYRNNNVTSADINQNREIDIFMFDGQYWMNGWFNGST